jgi:hypothetical protein
VRYERWAENRELRETGVEEVIRCEGTVAKTSGKQGLVEMDREEVIMFEGRVAKTSRNKQL